MSLCQMYIDKMPVSQMSVTQMSVSQMSVSQMSVSWMSVSHFVFGQMSVSQSLGTNVCWPYVSQLNVFYKCLSAKCLLQMLAKCFYKCLSVKCLFTKCLMTKYLSAKCMSAKCFLTKRCETSRLTLSSKDLRWWTFLNFVFGSIFDFTYFCLELNYTD